MNMEIGKRKAETGERRQILRVLALSRASRPLSWPAGRLPRFQVSAFKFPVSALRSPLSAFSLVEVTLALGIAGFCLIAMLGLIPAGMRNAATASEQTTTVGILGAVMSDLKGTPSGASASPRFGIPIPHPGSLASSNLYFSVDGGTKDEHNMDLTPSTARYAAVATLSAPANSTVVNTQVRVFWPAGATASNASGSIEGITVLDRF